MQEGNIDIEDLQEEEEEEEEEDGQDGHGGGGVVGGEVVRNVLQSRLGQIHSGLSARTRTRNHRIYHVLSAVTSSPAKSASASTHAAIRSSARAVFVPGCACTVAQPVLQRRPQNGSLEI
jgi:hypothetical protein